MMAHGKVVKLVPRSSCNITQPLIKPQNGHSANDFVRQINEAYDRLNAA